MYREVNRSDVTPSNFDWKNGEKSGEIDEAVATKMQELTHEIAALRTEKNALYNTIRAQLAEFDKQIYNRQNTIEKLYAEEFDCEEYSVRIGNYSCKFSPTGDCIYAPDEEEGYDTGICKFCGLPDERK